MAKSKSGKTTGKVLPVDNVEVEWTGESKSHKAGERSMLHKVQAEKLVEKGRCIIVEGGKSEKRTADFEKLKSE
jgi:hypothetical protein